MTTNRVEFVLGNAQFVLLHELAHLVIAEAGIPIIGREESAADHIAAMLLIRPPYPPSAGNNTLLKFALNAADGFGIAWQQGSNLGAVVRYWGTHSLTVQRFYTVSCLLYGSDPERFAALPEMVQMPMERAETCPVEYEKAAYAMDWLFATYARAEGDPPGAPMEIRFEPPPTRISQQLLEAVRNQGFIDDTFRRFSEVFALKAPATFIMRSCRQAQAAWLPETRELIFCYELLDTYWLLSQQQHREAIESLLDP
jgi:hypothetical protein